MFKSYSEKKAARAAARAIQKAEYKAKLETEKKEKFRKPEEVQSDLAGAYFTAGQLQFGMKGLEGRLNRENAAIAQLEAELEKSIKIHGEPKAPEDKITKPIPESASTESIQTSVSENNGLLES